MKKKSYMKKSPGSEAGGSYGTGLSCLAHSCVRHPKHGSGSFMEVLSRSHNHGLTQSLACLSFLEERWQKRKLPSFRSCLCLSGEQLPSRSPPRVPSSEQGHSYHPEIPRDLGLCVRNQVRDEIVGHKIIVATLLPLKL